MRNQTPSVIGSLVFVVGLGCSAARPIPAPRPPAQGTSLAVTGSRLLVNDQPTTLVGFRVGSAPLRDDWTDELLASLDQWRGAGVNALMIWLQGTSGGFHPIFTEDGAAFTTLPGPIYVRAGWGLAETRAVNGVTSGQQAIERTRRIIAAAEARGMVVILGIAYRHAMPAGATPEAVTRMMATAGRAFADARHVMFAVWNEAKADLPLEDPQRHRLYAAALKKAAPGRPVCAGSLEAEMNPAYAALPEIDAVCQDAGRSLTTTVAAFDALASVSKPILNVESYGGSGGGYVDLPVDAPAPPAGYALQIKGKSTWKRVYGAWEEEDYRDATDRLLMGRRSYRELVGHVVRAEPGQRHVMLHAAGWFQGASRTQDATQIGPRSQPDRWNNAFHGGVGTGAGTVKEPGIVWLLKAVTAQRAQTTDRVLLDVDPRGGDRANGRGGRASRT